MNPTLRNRIAAYSVHIVIRDNLRGATGSVVTPLKVD